MQTACIGSSLAGLSSSGSYRLEAGCVGDPGGPIVVTGAATSVATTSATLNASITSNGGTSTISFEYGLTTAYGSSVAATPSPLGSDAVNAAVSAPVIGLVCNTLYHYRARGVSANGEGVGDDATFSTAACVKQYTADSPSNGGSVTTAISGQISTCSFDSIQYVGAATVTATRPGATLFPYGLINFTTNQCGTGNSITLTLTFPQNLPADAKYYKFGPTADNPTNHWYVLPATINQNQVTVTITDGGLGDSNPAAGIISDPGGIGVTDPTIGVAAVPTLTEVGLMLLALLMASLGLRQVRSVSQRSRCH